MKEKIQNGKLEKLTRIAFLIVFLILGYETYLIFRERNIASVESKLYLWGQLESAKVYIRISCFFASACKINLSNGLTNVNYREIPISKIWIKFIWVG